MTCENRLIRKDHNNEGILSFDRIRVSSGWYKAIDVARGDLIIEKPREFAWKGRKPYQFGNLLLFVLGRKLRQQVRPSNRNTVISIDDQETVLSSQAENSLFMPQMFNKVVVALTDTLNRHIEWKSINIG